MYKTSEQINILYCTDKNYVMPMTVSITSVFENNKGSNVTVYIFFSSIEAGQEEKLRTLAQKYGQTICLIKIDDHYFSAAPTLRWSKETYYRLLVSELLPGNIRKVLYLDCDVIVNKSLTEIFNINFEDSSILARKESSSKSPRERLGLSSEGSYFQAGVLLFNIDKCKNLLNYQNSINIIKKLGNKLKVVDQDVMNVMFDGKIKGLDKSFNNFEITNFNENNLSRLLNKTKKNNINETVIFHYATGKPWNKMYAGSCEDIWYKYLNLSPYSELYTKKYSTLKYKVLRTGPLKMLFYAYIHATPIINNLAIRIFTGDTYLKLKNWYRKNIK